MTLEDTIRQVVREEVRAAIREAGDFAQKTPTAVQEVGWLDSEEVADKCGVEASTVREWCRTGRLRAAKIGRGWRVLSTELNQFLLGLTAAEGQPPEPEKEVARLLGRIRGG